MRTVYTIGYEGQDIEAFIASLNSKRIKRVADVRAIALSRKKGFSKTALSGALNQAGIEYVHFPSLGDPKAGREAARRGEVAEFRRIYTSVLKTIDARSALEELSVLAAARRTCLLCFERDPSDCHRLLIAERLKSKYRFEITNIMGEPLVGIKKHSRIRRRVSNGDTRKGDTSTEQQVW